MMEDKCIVKVGKLYVSNRIPISTNSYRCEVANGIDGARYLNVDTAKEVAKQIGGKVYRIDLKEVEL